MEIIHATEPLQRPNVNLSTSATERDLYKMAKISLIAALLLTNMSFGQSPRIVKLADLEKVMAEKSDKVHVINFWATWCGPCVKELPLFEKINAEARPDVKVTLVSMDLDLDENPEKVYNFVSRKNLKSEVLLLNESDANSWIDRIEKKWSGALPATLILDHKTGKRIFINRGLREGELEKYLDELE
jgi:thiol-disulfide isomerase/thioredoxin